MTAGGKGFLVSRKVFGYFLGHYLLKVLISQAFGEANY